MSPLSSEWVAHSAMVLRVRWFHRINPKVDSVLMAARRVLPTFTGYTGEAS